MVWYVYLTTHTGPNVRAVCRSYRCPLAHHLPITLPITPAFNAYSIFTSVSEYIKYSGDDAFLHLLVSNHTVSTWLELLALEWQQYTTPASPYLADYGGNPDNFLECVPT